MDALQVVAEPRRREILRLVWDQELSAGEIANRFDVSFPAVSQHLGMLLESGVVRVRKEGRRRLYKADRAALRAFLPALQRMWADQLERLAELAEEEEGK